MHEHIIPAREQRWVGRFVRATLFRRRKSRRRTVPGHLRHDPIVFEGNNGARLSGTWFPQDGARGVVVLAHPDRRYGQHWFMREGWIEWLHQHGYAAFTFDFVQYGGSRGGSTYLYQDVVRAVAQARRLAPDQPAHVVGLSLGAFATAVASPHLDVESITLESPYPDFTSWYLGATDDGLGGRGARFARWFERIFPATASYIQADKRVADARAERILIAASTADATTHISLTDAVAAAAPTERTRYLRLDGVEHLEAFQDPAFRDALLANLDGPQAGFPDIVATVSRQITV